MKKAICVMLAALLLLLQPAVLAEKVWGEWVRQEDGQWYRTGSDEGDPLTHYMQWAQGEDQDALWVSLYMYEERDAKGKLTVVHKETFNQEGVMLSHENYNFTEKGLLSTGSYTSVNEKWEPISVIICQISPDSGGGFTSVTNFTVEDTSVAILMTSYDKDGKLISCMTHNPNDMSFSIPAEPGEMDPIRDEWLRLYKQN